MKKHKIIARALEALTSIALMSVVLAAYAQDAWQANDRWFYVSGGVDSDAGAQKAISLIERAAKAELNGMLWAVPWDSADQWSEETIARMKRVKSAADQNGIEIVPLLWSIGYGTMIGRNPNLAEGLPVNALPMAAKNGKIEFAPEKIVLPNGDMETWKNANGLQLDGFHEDPGKISFRDDKVVHGGKTSLRFENFGERQYGHGRLMYNLDLVPGRIYRASVWFKAENVKGDVKLQAYTMDGEGKSNGTPNVKRDQNGCYNVDWTRIETIFACPNDGKIRLYAGIWEGEQGVFWLDDFEVEPIGLVNPLRRPGTPIVVRAADGKTTYEEGKDWIMPEFTPRPWNQNAPSQTLEIPAGSKIKDGERLAVDFYYPPLVGAPQIGTCMSEPALYECFEKSADAVVKLLNPKKWFLSMDEIRCAGTCKACQDRGISLAAILADCITKQCEIVKKRVPDADVYIWSDMLDPNHNAHDNYYVCAGDYTGVWDLIPKDLVVSCWYYEKREESMKFFSERGFRTQGAAYYDTDDLTSCRDWFDVCKRTPNCTGIMYTTWRSKYELLEDFGKLVAPKK